MKRYANRSGDSGVVAYEIGGGSITVQFQNGSIYRYTNASAGAANVAQMTTLAQDGKGLGTFISQHVGARYASKFELK